MRASLIPFDFDGAAVRVRVNLERIGYVYALESRCGRFVKVGYSAAPERRLGTLRSAANTAGREWISHQQFDAKRVEGAAHAQLASQRRMGEWFEASFDEVVGIVSGLLGESPTDDEVRRARRLDKRLTRMHVKQLSRTFFGSPPPREPLDGRDPCDIAVEFVLAEERRTVESNFTRTEEDFLSDFDREITDFATLELFSQNIVLIGRGIAYDQRKPMLKQYGMDFRMAHGGALLAATPTPEAQKEA